MAPEQGSKGPLLCQALILSLLNHREVYRVLGEEPERPGRKRERFMGEAVIEEVDIYQLHL